MGVQLSWLEHLPCKQGVKSSNLFISTIQECSSAGQSTTLIRWGSVVRVHSFLPLEVGFTYFFCVSSPPYPKTKFWLLRMQKRVVCTTVLSFCGAKYKEGVGMYSGPRHEGATRELTLTLNPKSTHSYHKASVQGCFFVFQAHLIPKQSFGFCVCKRGWCAPPCYHFAEHNIRWGREPQVQAQKNHP